MSKISTSDCKKYLIENFPETKSTLWKRVTKYKNVDGLNVRVFQYDSGRMVAVLENGDNLSIIKENEDLERKNENNVNYRIEEDSKKTSNEKMTSSQNGAQNFIFAIWEGEDLMPISQAKTMYIESLDFWLNEGGLSGEPDDCIIDYFPDEWCAEDVNGHGTWVISTDLNSKDLKSKMIALGFKWSKDFHDYINQDNLNSFDEEDELESINSKKCILGNKPSDYIFTVLKNLDENNDVIIYITPISYWKKHGYMYDQPNYKPAEFFPSNWSIEDVNEGGCWVLQTDSKPYEVHTMLLDIGFIYEKSFDEFINSNL